MIRNRYFLTRFAGFVASVLLVMSVGLVAIADAQEYYFGTGPVAGGGNAMAEIEISINGRELTAIIRNTSPDQSNYGGDSSVRSPTISGFAFDLVSSSGESLVLEDWSLTAYKNSGRTRILSDASKPKWETSNTDNTFAFSTILDRNGLHNSDASGGLANKPEYAKFTEAVLRATFDDTVSLVGDPTGTTGDPVGGDPVGGNPGTIGGSVNLVEDLPETFSPLVRFGNVGSALDPQTFDSYGTTEAGTNPGGTVSHSPEPGSFLIWALGIVACVGTKRRLRPTARA